MASPSTSESSGNMEKRKSSCDHDLSLPGAKRLKGQITDFAKCIICQKKSGKTYKVSSAALETLKTAANARQDNVFDRLCDFLDSNSFLQDKSPLWHPECRNKYLLKKSYERIENQRLSLVTSASPSFEYNRQIPVPDIPMLTERRSLTPKYNRRLHCVVCCKLYDKKGKRAKSLVTTDTRQRTFMDKAKELKDYDILSRIQGYGDDPIDMVANDICYHMCCMNKYMARRTQVPKESAMDVSVEAETPAIALEDPQHRPPSEKFDKSFQELVESIADELFKELSGFLLSTLRDMYRKLLRDLGVPTWNSYRSANLKRRLQLHFGDSIVFFPRRGGSDYVCSSSISIGDVMNKLKTLEDDQTLDEEIVLQTARILRERAKSQKATHSTQNLEDLLDVSVESAKNQTPDIILKFCLQLFSDHTLKFGDGTEMYDDDIMIKALLMSQQLLYAICGIKTPLTVGAAFEIYNSTRSKTQMTMMNRLSQSISYDTFQRHLTSVYNSIINKVQESGTYLPPNMEPGKFTQFAMDNIDWQEKTQDGTTFHATSSIMIQPPKQNDKNKSTEQPKSINHKGDVEKAMPSITRSKAIQEVPHAQIEVCRLSTSDRKLARKLSQETDVTKFSQTGLTTSDILLMMWELCRLSPTQLLDIDQEDNMRNLGFSAFCASFSKFRLAHEIGYLPLIPSSPTNPGVVKTTMTNLVHVAQAIGMEHTIITADQAIYEIAYTIRKQYPEQFSSVILHMGGFHLAHNFMSCITKIMRGSGAVDLLVASGTLLPGTANKCFGEKCDYYQTIHALTVLYEVMVSLRWEAFENWCIKENKDVSCLQELNDKAGDTCKTTSMSDVECNQFKELRLNFNNLQDLLIQFSDTHSCFPTQKVWETFIEMTGILLRFIHAQREGSWLDYLQEATRMLPFIVAAGHHKYGVYLPLYLQEMRELPEKAPQVYDRYIDHGDFSIRRSQGRHNGVSADMVLEQTYNADVKQRQGLRGITLNPRAQIKWLYTKPVTAAVAGNFRQMLGMGQTRETPLQANSNAQTTRESEAVNRTIGSIVNHMINPFTSTSTQLINIANGEIASKQVCHDLTHVKEIGQNAMKKCLDEGGDKLSVVKLKTFDSMKSTKNKQTKQIPLKKAAEVTVLQRISQVIASGGEVRIDDLIGRHECTTIPPSLFDTSGRLRRGTKSTLVQVLLKETETNEANVLPSEQKETSVIIDAMHFVHRCTFLPNETFSSVQNRYFKKIMAELPDGTSSVHFCCDRYDHKPSLKSMERDYRKGDKVLRQYDIKGHLPTPCFRDFIVSDDNKAALLSFLSESWSHGPLHQESVHQFIISGGFQDEIKTVVVSAQGVTDIPELQSTQEEADTRIILHIIYSAEVLGAKRIVVVANDTDIIVHCIYYYSQRQIDELWIKTNKDKYLPIHEIARKLGVQKCTSLPFFHAISGKDDTSFIFGLGKKKMWKVFSKISMHPFSEFPNEDVTDIITIPRSLIEASIRLLVKACGGSEEDTFATLRTQKFLSGSSGTLLGLPPTEDAFMQHIKRSALATLVSKAAHLAKPPKWNYEAFGWLKNIDGDLEPLRLLSDPLPENLKAVVSCRCKRKCAGNCQCSKNNVACYSACACQGLVGTCSRAEYIEPE